jgi:hypothetical protein
MTITTDINGFVTVTLSTIPPRWAFERVEQERCAYQGLQPNPLNIDVVMSDPIGWAHYHSWAAYVARMEGPR